MRVALGITGSIAAYKAAELVRRMMKNGDEVRVVMTRHAAEFIGPLTLQTLSQNPVAVDQFAPVEKWEIGHIETARWAEAVVVAPATANAIAKFASGIADDTLSTLLIATKAPVIIAPAMNPAMWSNTQIKNAVARLSEAGVLFVGPDAGETACGEEGWGRLTGLERIVGAVRLVTSPRRDLEGMTVLVSAGPTREHLDPIRFLSNSSTGLQGYRIAEAAMRRGGRVILVSGPVSLSAPMGVEVIRVTSAQEMHRAVMERARDSDLIIMTAAVADYTFREVHSAKLKKGPGDLTLSLTRTPDILARLGEEKRPDQILVGFAAESDDLEPRARTKMASKNCDMIVANLIKDGFGTPNNSVLILDREGSSRACSGDKRLIAEEILTEAVRLRRG